MFTVGKLAKEFCMSRSALLYYDRIGLLKPSGRSDSGYRLYSQEDRDILAKICRFRETGLSLAQIKAVLASSPSDLAQILEKRLDSLNHEIRELRNQQQVILAILKDKQLAENNRYMDRNAWTQLLERAGLDEKGRHKWHLEFENMSSKAHADFLKQLGFSKDEIKDIQRWALAYDEK